MWHFYPMWHLSHEFGLMAEKIILGNSSLQNTAKEWKSRFAKTKDVKHIH